MQLGEGERAVGEACWTHTQCTRSQEHTHCHALVCACNKGFHNHDGKCSRNIWEDLGLAQWELIMIAFVITLIALGIFTGCIYVLISKIARRYRKTSPAADPDPTESFDCNGNKDTINHMDDITMQDVIKLKDISKRQDATKRQDIFKRQDTPKWHDSLTRQDSITRQDTLKRQGTITRQDTFTRQGTITRQDTFTRQGSITSQESFLNEGSMKRRQNSQKAGEEKMKNINKKVNRPQKTLRVFETQLIDGDYVESQLVSDDMLMNCDYFTRAPVIPQPTKFILPLSFRSKRPVVRYSNPPRLSHRSMSNSSMPSSTFSGTTNTSTSLGWETHTDSESDWQQPTRNQFRRLGQQSPAGTTRLPLLLRSSTFSESDDSP